MNIPIFNAIITTDTMGIDRISLVSAPAVKSDFLKFSKNVKQVMFSADEEKRIITGVLMRCDFPIYRNDEQLGEYYIKFDANTCRMMAEKLLFDDNQNKVNIEHLPNSDVEGVEMFELFIKDTEKGINPTGFEDITNGSLFATFKVYNEKIWEAIKAGKFNGFSIEGTFEFEDVENDVDEELNEVLTMLDELYRKTHKG